MEIEGKADSQAVSDLLASMDDVIQKDPSVSESFRNKRNELFLVSTVAATVRPADIDDLTAVIEDFKKGANNFGGAGMDTEAEQAALKYLENRRSKMTTALKDDALQWGIDNGLVEEPVTTLFNDQGEFDQNAIIQRTVNAETVATHYGLAAPQYLTKREVDQFTRIIKQKDMPPNNKLAFIADFQKAFKGKAADVFLQMGDKGAYEISALGALVNAGRNDAALAIIKGMEEFDAGLKITGETEGNIQAIFFEHLSVGDENILANLATEDQAALYRLSKAHYKGLGKLEFDEDDFVASIDVVLGADGTRGGIQRVRDVRTLLPPDMTADEVENFLDNLNKNMVDKMLGFVGNNDPDMKLSEALIFDIRQRNDDYVLKYFNNDDYYIFDQARNAIVRFPNNEVFFINLEQMRLDFPEAFTTEVKRGFFSGKIKE